MRALVCQLLLLVATIASAQIDNKGSEDTWIESAEASSTDDIWEAQFPTLGGKTAVKPFSKNGRRLSFIGRELNRIRAKCKLPPVKDIASDTMYEQIVNGVEYDVEILIDGKEKSTVSIVRLNDAEVHPTHGPKPGDSTRKQGE